MNKKILIFILLVTFYVNGSSSKSIDIYQFGIDQKYTVYDNSISINLGTDTVVIPDVVKSTGILINKQLINFAGRPTLWFSNDSSSNLDSYSTLFVLNKKLLIDCVYINAFDNHNGFHQKISKCGLNLSIFEKEDAFDDFIYEQKQIDKVERFSGVSQDSPIKILIGKLNDLQIYRIYSSIKDYEDDIYSIVLSSEFDGDFIINHPIYLRFNSSNRLIGFDLENISQNSVELQFYSYRILKALIRDNINPQNSQMKVNSNKIFLYKTPCEKDIDTMHLVYSDKIVLIDEYQDNDGVIWYKIIFNHDKSKALIAWIKSKDVNFILKK